MAIICDGYPKVQVFKDNFVSIQRAITRLVDGLLEEGSPLGSLKPTGQKGLPLWYAKTKRPETGWVAK